MTILQRIAESLSYYDEEFADRPDVWKRPISDYCGGITPNDLKCLVPLKCFFEDDDPLPKKFVAIYADGSGAGLWCRNSKGTYDSVGDREIRGVDRDWFIDADHLHYIALPDDFRFWGEMT